MILTWSQESEEMKLRGSQKSARMRTEQLHGDKHLDNITAGIQCKRHMKVIKSEVLEQTQSQRGDLLDKAVKEPTHAIVQPLRKGSAERQSRQNRPQKVFIDRKSLLDELLEVKDFRSFCNMIVVMLSMFALSTTALDFMDERRLINLFIFAFGNLPMALFAWLCMFFYSLLVPYKFLQMWASSLRTVKHPGLFTATTTIALLICHAVVLGFYPIYTVIYHRLGPASCFIVSIEQVRFLMKIHSFLWESMPPILYSKSQDGKMHPPEFSTYLYFLFCPTLIYRKSYPRTPYVRWGYVIKNFAQFFGCVFYLNFIMERLCIPVFSNIIKQSFSIKTLVLSIIYATLPGAFLLLFGFYGLLHCWMNAFAEMLRFADRIFYKDWWNSTSFSTYYRTWNVIVHDWLYYYIYQDILWLLRGKSQVIARTSVIFISAVFHEYTCFLGFGFFYPVCFTLFACFGVILTFIDTEKRKGPVWNVLFWTLAFIGQGIQVGFYFQEWYARIHCPLQEMTFWGMVTPRSWSCYAL